MSNYFDFNDTTAVRGFSVIPNGTLAKVMIYIKSGGYNDERQGWTGGYASISRDTGSVYLNCEITVVAGDHEGRKFYHNIGLHSQKNELWGNMGRSMIRGILNSANGLRDDDNSPQAQNKRRIADFSALDGLQFVARIGIQKNDPERNELKAALDPSHEEYAALMEQRGPSPQVASNSVTSTNKPTPNPSSAARPAWAR